MDKPRIEIVFKRGRPTVAFFHVREGQKKTGRHIAIRHTIVAHYDEAGLPTGIEVPLPLVVSAFDINDALREVGSGPVEEADLAPLRLL